MNKAHDFHDSLRKIATLWTEYFEKQYDQKYYNAVKLLTKKAGLKHLDKDSEYTAGLLYVELYDLFGALANQSIKNVKIAEGIIDLLTEGYQADAGDLWKILNSMSGVILPWEIFIEVYKLFEPDTELKITDPEAQQGFIMFSNSLWQNSSIGYLFEHSKEL